MTPDEVGVRLSTHPWLMIRMLIGTRLLAPLAIWFRKFIDWLCGFKRECTFGIVSNPVSGYAVRVSDDSIQWYDDLDEAAQALCYHASQWRDSQRTSDSETAPTRAPKPKEAV